MRKMLLPAFFMFAILQTSFAFPESALQTTLSPNPIEEITNVLPKSELQALKLKHLKSDPGFQAAVQYFKSSEFAQIIEDVRNTPEWIEYKQFVKEAGLDLDYLIRHVEHCLNATDTNEFKVEGVKPSLTSFFDDVKMTYGVQIMKGMHDYVEKAGRTDQYKKFIEQVTSAKSKELLEKAMQQPALQKFVQKLKEMDVNVDYVIQMVYSFSGWQPLTTA